MVGSGLTRRRLLRSSSLLLGTAAVGTVAGRPSADGDPDGPASMGGPQAPGHPTSRSGTLPAVDQTRLNEIRRVLGEDPGFVGVAPIPGQEPHVGVFYRTDSPDDIIHRLTAAGTDVEDVPLRVHTHVTPTPLVRRLSGNPEARGTAEMTTTPQLERRLGPGRPLFIRRPDSPFTLACTANFIYEDESETRYIGTAGHCVLGEGVEDSQGDDFEQPEVWACVQNCASSGFLGELVELGDVLYAQRVLKDDIEDVLGEDFAFIRIPSDLDVPIDPTMPVWGGPRQDRSSVILGDRVGLYGQGLGFGDADADSRAGAGLATFDDDDRNPPDEWWAALPGSGGDSGGPVVSFQTVDQLTPDQQALGLVTHGLTPAISIGTTSAHAADVTESVIGVKLDLATSEAGFLV